MKRRETSAVPRRFALIMATLLAWIVLMPASTSSATRADLAHRDAFTGTWAGKVDQPGSLPYSVKVTIYRTTNGYRANVKYPQLLCGGIWKYQGRESRTLRFVERIRYQGVCGDGVDISLKARSGGTLDYKFSTARSTGSAVLRPAKGVVGPGIKSPGHGLVQWPTAQDEAGSALMIWFGAAWRMGEWELGFPTWSSCIEQDLCIAGTNSQVGVVQRGSGGFYTVAEFSVDTPARWYLQYLGYDDATIAALLN